MGGRREACGGVGAQSVRRRRHGAAAAAGGCNLAVTGGDVLTSMVMAEEGGMERIAGLGRLGPEHCSQPGRHAAGPGPRRCLLTV